MPNTIPANTACESERLPGSIGNGSEHPTGSHSVTEIDAATETIARMVTERMPNLFRLFINPHVTAACHLLTAWVHRFDPASDPEPGRVFLANSGEEALSGAIKLLQYAAEAEGRSTRGVVIDPEGQFEGFVKTTVGEQTEVVFLPGLDHHIGDNADTWVRKPVAEPNAEYGFAVMPQRWFAEHADAVADRLRSPRTDGHRIRLVIIADPLANPRGDSLPIPPDLTVFDERFTRREIPFGAFVGGSTLFEHWRCKGMSTFHSTTFQPNTIASSHLLRCVDGLHPEFVAKERRVLDRIVSDFRFRTRTFADLFSPVLVKLTRLAGLQSPEVTTDGHSVRIGGRKIFDGVAGVACSLRGHNPIDSLADLRETRDDPETVFTEVRQRLAGLTGLGQVFPAVSGASAVEQALKLGLAAHSPRKTVLVLKGGFGGKTLFALTGTERTYLRRGLPHLYPDVIHVDPFAADAPQRIRNAFRTHAVGVVELELIQGVGGVREIPESVLTTISELRGEHEFAVFVDEVQTGMFRTGTFTRSRGIGFEPDLLTLGKSTSDMLVPSSLTLCSDRLAERLAERGCSLTELFARRHRFPVGMAILRNSLRHAERVGTTERVRAASERFGQRLADELSGCPAVREVRRFGLLIGIELNTDRRFAKLQHRFALLAMLHHSRFPLLTGFCQYEPHVLKFTPPLSITEDEIDAVCRTFGDVLRRSSARSFASGLRRVIGSLVSRKFQRVPSFLPSQFGESF